MESKENPSASQIRNEPEAYGETTMALGNGSTARGNPKSKRRLRPIGCPNRMRAYRGLEAAKGVGL